MLVFHCIGCGHEHPVKPKGNVCESCGRATVVDLSALTAAELRQALDAPPPSWRYRLRDVGGALVLVGIIGAILLLGALFVSNSQTKMAAEVEPLLVRPSVFFTLPAAPGGEPVDAGAWVPTAQGYLQSLRDRSAQLGPCVQGLEPGTDLLLRFSIGADGTTSAIDVDRSGDRGRASECLTAAVSAWTFTAPSAAPVRVVVPYGVSVGEGGVPGLSLPAVFKLVQR